MVWESAQFIDLGVFLITAAGLAALGFTIISETHEEAAIA